MHILLINTNPVVSRLLALCTRDDSMTLEEVDNITEIKRDDYDVVFVDEMSYKDEVLVLDEYLKSTYKVLFSNEDIEISAFDITIKKPFLPSQIIDILENTSEGQQKEESQELEVEEESISIFPLPSEDEVADEAQVLDVGEIEKIKALLDMDDEEHFVPLNDDELEMRKIEVIKEQLVSEGLEIVEEDYILEEFSDDKKDAKKVTTLVKNKQEKKKKEKSKKKSKKKNKKTLEYTEQELEKIEDAIQMAIATLKRKQMKKLLKGKKIEVNVQIEGRS